MAIVQMHYAATREKQQLGALLDDTPPHRVRLYFIVQLGKQAIEGRAEQAAVNCCCRMPVR